MSLYRSLLVVASVSAFAALAGCAKDPSKDAPAAKVSEPAPEAPEAKPAEPAPPVAPTAMVAPAAAPSPTAAAPAEAIALSGKVSFIGSKVTGSHNGEFTNFKGSVTLKDGKPEDGQLEFTVQTASLITTDANPMKEKLEGHMKGPDFFDVEKFPTATFTSSEIVAGGPNGATHTIKGKLTLRGVTKDIEFPATLSVVGKDISGRTEFSINRKDFGIVYAGMPNDLIRDGVVIRVDVKATLP
jgi:polyisoprenoid-binding protein YceI